MNGFLSLEERADDASLGIDLGHGPRLEIRPRLTGDENRAARSPVEIVGIISKRKFRALFDAAIVLQLELHHALLTKLRNEEPVATSVENNAIRHCHFGI